MRVIDSLEETRFTALDYERLPEGFPCELIEGQLVKEPSPTFGHQDVIARLVALLVPRVAPGCVACAPLDVHLDDFNVLQPDVLVWRSAPDRDAQRVPVPVVVVEVLSPSTAERDRGRKTRLYLTAGAAEVWLIEPTTGAIEVHTTAGVTTHGPDENVTSRAIPAFSTSGADLTR